MKLLRALFESDDFGSIVFVALAFVAIVIVFVAVEMRY